MKKESCITDYSGFSDDELLRELEKKTGYRFEDEELSLADAVDSVCSQGGKPSFVADAYCYSHYTDYGNASQKTVTDRILPVYYLSKIKKRYCAIVLLNGRYTAVYSQPVNVKMLKDLNAVSDLIESLSHKHKCKYAMITQISKNGEWKDCFEPACQLNMKVKSVKFLDWILVTPKGVYSAQAPFSGINIM